MEKDSFETALQKIMLQSDENSQQLAGKENVWAGINKTKPIKKWYYYAAAAVLILSISIGFLSIQKDTITSPIAKKDIPPQLPLLKAEIIKETPIILSQKTKLFPQNKTIEKLIITDTPVGKLPVKPIELNVSFGKETIAVTVQKPVENNTIINQIIATQPEFTVQFKRGKPTETGIEKQTKIAIAFNKLSFGRDTSTFILANAKPNNPFKIKF